MNKTSLSMMGALSATVFGLTLLSGGPAPMRVAAAAPGDAPKVAVVKQDTGTLSAVDKAFIQEAAAGGLAEVELGKLAVEKGMSDSAKTFGQHMVEDHTKANNELSQLASRKGVAVPMELKAEHVKLKNTLSKTAGPAFDKQYIREMVKDHEKDVAAFEKEASQGSDPELVAWVKATLPTLQGHLKMSRDAEAKVKGGSK